MNTTKQLIEQLQKLTGKKVLLRESIDRNVLTKIENESLGGIQFDETPTGFEAFFEMDMYDNEDQMHTDFDRVKRKLDKAKIPYTFNTASSVLKIIISTQGSTGSSNSTTSSNPPQIHHPKIQVAISTLRDLNCDWEVMRYITSEVLKK